MTGITFVSSVFYLTIEDEQNIDKNIQLFSTLLKHVNVCLFVLKKYAPQFEVLKQNMLNCKIYEVEEEKTPMFDYGRIFRDVTQLPKTRNEQKDTFDFILNAYNKYELIEQTISKNPHATSHFAWFDFTHCMMFNEYEKISGFFKMLNDDTIHPCFLAIPGCWKNMKPSFETLMNEPHWRFCGGFFIGDLLSVSTFCKMCKENIEWFLTEQCCLTWDFNYWAWLETNNKLKINWYLGNHNDELVNIPAYFYSKQIPITEKQCYEYPPVETLFAGDNEEDLKWFTPTSASHLFVNGEHWLNTRFVNYRINKNGSYFIPNDEQLIKNKNVLSRLDENYTPVSFVAIDEQLNIPVNINAISRGLEDVRLFEGCDNNVKFVATTVSHSSCNTAKIVCGNYDLDNARVIDCFVLKSPNQNTNRMEKNWIPVKLWNYQCDIVNDNNINLIAKDAFIYEWNPLKIGCLDKNTNELIIVHETSPIENIIFNKMKGSTKFVETDEGLVGVVHFSERDDAIQPHILYYHMIVVLDKMTFQPIKHSTVFCFENLGIEYCLGFAIESASFDNDNDNNTNYIFWISRNDKNPMMMKVDANDVKWVQCSHM